MRITTVLFLVIGIGLAGETDDLLATFAAGFESRVTEFKLKNGLEVIVYVDSSTPVVSTSVFYRVGSYYDPTGMTGLSHMTEHMTFQRSSFYKPGEFFRIVRRAGGSNNGFTPDYYTGYYETFSSDRWELALKIEAARMARCQILEGDFASEHQVVAEETRLGQNSPWFALYSQFYSTALLANPQRNTGWPDDVNRFTADGVRDWYQRYYNPANAVLVIAGDVKPDKVKPMVEKYFGGFKGKPVALPDYYNVEPEQTGPRRVVVRRAIQQPTMMIGFHTPGVRDSNFLAGQIAAAVLGGGRTSRLHKALVVQTGLASSVYAYNSVERDPGLLFIGITPKAESLVPRIEQVVERELARVRTELVTDRESEQFRNAELVNRIFSRDNVSYVGFFLAGTQIARGSWREFANDLVRVNKVTKEQVRDFCRQYLVEDNCTVGLLLNRKEER